MRAGVYSSATEASWAALTVTVPIKSTRGGRRPAAPRPVPGTSARTAAEAAGWAPSRSTRRPTRTASVRIHSYRENEIEKYRRKRQSTVKKKFNSCYQLCWCELTFMAHSDRARMGPGPGPGKNGLHYFMFDVHTATYVATYTLGLYSPRLGLSPGESKSSMWIV